ncbi:MAG: DoxX family protein [Chitinophagaceae bacterium]|nr:DoxX family protein [Chitinophagaceae bacterium]
MNMLHQIRRWEYLHRKIVILILRVVLGIIITLKGIFFLSNYNYLESLLSSSLLHRFAGPFWVYYITFANLLCGIFLIIGLFTRIALSIQIPMLIGAVLFINPGEHALRLNGEFVLSVLVLGALCYFLIKGPGEMSMDNYLKNNEL